jgi:predicted Zn-dependent protease
MDKLLLWLTFIGAVLAIALGPNPVLAQVLPPHPMLLPAGQTSQYPPVFGLGRPNGGVVNEAKAINPKRTTAPLALGHQAATQADDVLPLFTKGPDYLNLMNEGGYLARWSILKQPIRIYVNGNPKGLQNFQAGFTAQVHKAAEAWLTALEHRIDIAWVKQSATADIKVDWTNQIETKGFSNKSGVSYTAGVTRPLIIDNQLRTMDITLATFDLRQKPNTTNDIYILALHELGHALGLRGHSVTPTDIMFSQPSGLKGLSPQDITSIRRLYAQPVAITNLPKPIIRSTSHSNQNKQLTENNTIGRNNAKATQVTELSKQITQLEAHILTQGSGLAYQNLGALYFQKGKLLTSMGRLPTADKPPEHWYKQALVQMSKAIEKEPLDAFAYANRAIVYRQLQQPAMALTDLQHAVQLQPNEASFYRQQAWVYEALGQKAEGKNALQEYLYRQPDGATTDEVITLQRQLK